MSNFLDATGLAYFWGKIKEALNGKADKSTTYTKTDIDEILEDYVGDVQINGTSVVNNGNANIPIASGNVLGTVMVANGSHGLALNNYGRLMVSGATSESIKSGSSASVYNPITVSKQNESVFYGLAQASGDTTQSLSENAVGTYTSSAKTAIRTMLGVDTASILQEVEDGLPSAEGVSF